MVMKKASGGDSPLQQGAGKSDVYAHVCDDLKFDNKFEVPVMHSPAIPEPLLRYT
jgi:hypothetical protein